MPVYKKVNRDFFKKWTPQMAYVLGFFAADGYMTKNKRGAHFWNIQINDKILLQQIKKVIQSEHKVSKKTKIGNWNTSYRLQIGSKEMYLDLYRLGMRPNKTKSLTVPSIPSAHFSHFVRGYFDGDGSIWMGYVHKERKTSTLTLRTVFTSCSKNFLGSLRSKLAEFGVDKGVLSKGAGNYYRLVYSVINSLRLRDFMYNVGAADLFLLRKKRVFDKFIKMQS